MNSWHLITSGHLTRNKFWGEDEGKMYHPVISTTTVIQTGNYNILVDPSMNADQMKMELYSRCGLRAEEIDLIYSTHKHYDHWMGVDGFPNAEFYMASEDLDYLHKHMDYIPNDRVDILKKAKPAREKLVEGISLVALPGHTMGLQGLLFEGPEGKILIAGDSVMTYEFFQAKEGYFFSVSDELSKKSIEKAAQIADFIIPGHGNYFSVKAYPFKVNEEKEKADRVQASKEHQITVKSKISEILKLKGAMNVFQTFFHHQLPISDLMVNEDMPLLAYIINLDQEIADQMLAAFNQL